MMRFIQVRRGTSRWILVIPLLGISLKVARVKIWPAFAESFRYLCGEHFRRLKRWWSTPVDLFTGVPSLLLRGLVCNWREWKFSRTGHPFVAKTYLTTGFINIQEYVPPLPTSVSFYRDALLSAVDEEYLSTAPDQHSLTDENFGIKNGRLRMVDYGSRDMPEFIAHFGDRLLALRF